MRFGEKFMTVLYAADAIAVRHLAIAELRHSDIGRLSFEQVVRVVSPGLSPIIESHTESFNMERKCA